MQKLDMLKYKKKSSPIFIGSRIRERQRRNSDNFEAAAGAADDIISKLQNDLVIPSGSTVLETSEVETELEIQAVNGEDAGSCDETGCTCEDGFEADGNGGCTLPGK